MARTCNVSDNGCLAPAGIRSGNGMAEGTRSTRATCFVCGEPVCTNCSKIMPWHPYGRRRVCLTCQDNHHLRG